MIWGSMSSARVGPLCFLKTNVTAPIYQEFLEHFMLPSAEQLFKDADFIFQQDLAPDHTAKSTKSQIKSLLLSHHHSTSALVSEILTSVLQTVQKKIKNTTIYIWTVHIYRLYRRQCAKYTYIYSVHTVYYKDIVTNTHYIPYVPVAAAGLSKSGSSFSANIIKIVHLFIRKFCSSFSRKCSSLLYV